MQNIDLCLWENLSYLKFSVSIERFLCQSEKFLFPWNCKIDSGSVGVRVGLADLSSLGRGDVWQLSFFLFFVFYKANVIQ